MKKKIFIVLSIFLILTGCTQLESITLSKSELNLLVSESAILKFETNLKDNSEEKFEWTSSNEAVAIVDSNGRVTGVSQGKATISITGNSKVVADCSVTVTNVVAISLSIAGSREIGINEFVTLTWAFTPTNTTDKSLNWVSSNVEVATVSDGVVKGIKSGKTTITATAHNGINASYEVTVIKKVESITVSPSSVTLYTGDKKTLTVSYSPSDAMNKSVVWTSSDDDVASVNNGVVTAGSPGTAIITARTSNGKSSTTVIEVKEKPIVYSGYGNKVINNVNVPYGQYKVTMSHSGSGNFVIWFYEEDDVYGDLLVNEIGKYSGAAVLRDGESAASRNAQLEVMASGSWKITIERISGTTTTNVKGTGSKVSGYFYGNNKRNTVDIKYTGSSNFIVIVYSELGYDELLANEIGSYTGQVTYYTYSGVQYFFYVQSSGTWYIDFNLGDPLTTIS